MIDSIVPLGNRRRFIIAVRLHQLLVEFYYLFFLKKKRYSEGYLNLAAEERGRRNPYTTTLNRLCKILSIFRRVFSSNTLTRLDWIGFSSSGYVKFLIDKFLRKITPACSIGIWGWRLGNQFEACRSGMPPRGPNRLTEERNFGPVERNRMECTRLVEPRRPMGLLAIRKPLKHGRHRPPGQSHRPATR